MYKKILVANRGEIACRIIRSARDLGIRTVAIYSDADKRALHTEMADEAFYAGDSPSSHSYLNIPVILDIVKRSGSEAVHPGYGFMSENPEFVKSLQQHNVEFIGPPMKAISSMGDKITSKKIALAANVSTVPGHMGIIENIKEAKEIGRQIGYPIMVKASAGGGGKGMRVVKEEKDLAESFEISKRESASSFGDDRIFIEKFIQNPRHIEIQIIGDKFGNYIHLGERECSIQRRNQKVIEEAPSPFIRKDTREAMAEQAIALAREVKYYSAGTVEFIVDSKQNFYFLEMNTRLQVEHPVTELITGIDIVKEMISISLGNKLSVSQNQIKFNGWAIESRVYAEDPNRGFLPSIGRLTKYKVPKSEDTNSASIRNDTGVREGDTISLFYDPMLSKLCTWAKDRNSAVKEMAAALDFYQVEGIQTNIPFLSTIFEDKDFIDGNIHTGFIDEKYPDGFKGADLEISRLKTLLAVIASIDLSSQNSIKEIDTGSKFERSAFYYTGSLDFEITFLGNNKFSVNFVGDSVKTIELPPNIASSFIHANVDDLSIALRLERTNGSYLINYRGLKVKCMIVRTELLKLLELMPKKERSVDSKILSCPMPGMLVSMEVSVGTKVEEGQSVCVVEAMKMENVLYAENPGTVKSINFSVGDTLSLDDTIIEFE